MEKAHFDIPRPPVAPLTQQVEKTGTHSGIIFSSNLVRPAKDSSPDFSDSQVPAFLKPWILSGLTIDKAFKNRDSSYSGEFLALWAEPEKWEKINVPTLLTVPNSLSISYTIGCISQTGTRPIIIFNYSLPIMLCSYLLFKKCEWKIRVPWKVTSQDNLIINFELAKSWWVVTPQANNFFHERL